MVYTMKCIEIARKYKGTVIITGIFILTFIVDAVFRFLGGLPLLDFVLGRNADIGIYITFGLKQAGYGRERSGG